MPPLPTTSKATEPTAAAPPVTMGPAAFSGRRTLRAPPPNLDEVPFAPEPRKSDCAQSKTVFGESEEQKCSAPVYPWMQRMNSCNSEFTLLQK